MEYTKGDWNINLAQPYDEHEFEVSYDTSDGLTYPIADIHKVEDGEAEANARLIAQAPKLYEALKGLLTWAELSYTEDTGIWADENDPAIIQAKQAITKVEGK